MVLDDSLYQRAKVVAAQRGTPVASLIEEALRLLLADSAEDQINSALNLPSWNMGASSVDLNDSHALRDALDQGLDINALR